MIRTLLVSTALGALVILGSLPATSATILDDWSKVAVPAAPPAVAVKADPATTALLVLDWVKQTCSGPRCSAAVPGVAKLLQRARAAKAFVVYSYLSAPGTSPADILPAVAPLGGEPFVLSGPNKFLGTDLQKILTDKGIKTVIVTGVAAHGAYLYTASHAALLGFDVIAPVDGASGESAYAEQYVVWNLANAPRIGAKTKITTLDQISFGT